MAADSSPTAPLLPKEFSSIDEKKSFVFYETLSPVKKHIYNAFFAKGVVVIKRDFHCYWKVSMMISGKPFIMDVHVYTIVEGESDLVLEFSHLYGCENAFSEGVKELRKELFKECGYQEIQTPPLPQVFEHPLTEKEKEAIALDAITCIIDSLKQEDYDQKVQACSLIKAESFKRVDISIWNSIPGIVLDVCEKSFSSYGEYAKRPLPEELTLVSLHALVQIVKVDNIPYEFLENAVKVVTKIFVESKEQELSHVVRESMRVLKDIISKDKYLISSFEAKPPPESNGLPGIYGEISKEVLAIMNKISTKTKMKIDYVDELAVENARKLLQVIENVRLYSSPASDFDYEW